MTTSFYCCDNFEVSPISKRFCTGCDVSRKKGEARQNASMEQKRRRAYLREFYGLESSATILNYNWPSIVSMENMPPLDDPEFNPKLRGYTLDTVKLKASSKQIMATFHVDRKMHQLIHKADLAKEDLSSGSLQKKYAACRKGVVVSPYMPDPPHGMDEQAIIKGLFDSIDTRKTGVITRDQFLKAAQNDQRTRAWLQKTFLWSLYKARKLCILLDLFDSEQSPAITFPDFYRFIQRCQLETNVPSSQIRRLIGMRAYFLHSRLNRPLQRHEVGRRVEFLFQRGPIWQPGRVVKANSDGTYDIRCDLYDGDIFLKMESENPAERSNQQEEKEEQEGRWRDESEFIGAFYDIVVTNASGSSTACSPEGDERGLVSAIDILREAQDPQNSRFVSKCKAIAALNSYPVIAEALKYTASDEHMPGISRQEWNVFCDAILDLLSINNLNAV